MHSSLLRRQVEQTGLALSHLTLRFAHVWHVYDMASCVLKGSWFLDPGAAGAMAISLGGREAIRDPVVERLERCAKIKNATVGRESARNQANPLTGPQRQRRVLAPEWFGDFRCRHTEPSADLHDPSSSHLHNRDFRGCDPRF